MDKNNPLFGKKIAFLGDSITLGYSLDDYADRFATVICKKYGATELNFGITGTLVARAGMNRNDGRSYLDRASLAADGDYIVVFGGTNDYFWSDRGIYPKDGVQGDDCFICAVKKLLEYYSGIGAAARTLIVTPYPHNGIGNYYGGADYNTSSRHDTSKKNFNGHTLEDYVAVLEAEAKRFNIAVLNLHDVKGFDWKLHTTDGCHPNVEGHLWLAEKIGGALEQIAVKGEN